ncbi:hypothetical protein, partial [Salinicola aestuarinus]|uniref:hypothetical protein n=1 Tax=Salinicola aestuarinus TaxID=1949082 RepID=UPI0013004504
RVWVRRSIFGVPGRQEAPFASLEEEQESLEMVIRGISVDIDVIPQWRRMDNAGAVAAFEQADHPGEGAYSIASEISFPSDIRRGGVFVTVSQFISEAETIMGKYVVTKSSRELNGIESAGGFEEGGSANYGSEIQRLVAESEGALNTVLINSDSLGLPGSVQVIVELLPKGSGVRDVFRIPLSSTERAQ